MSYDLIVFDPSVAPRDREEFISWYRGTAVAELGQDYDAPFTSPGLRSWLFEMVSDFPPLNGSLASRNVDDPRLSDYGLSPSMIYVCFAWSQASAANKSVRRLAAKHGVGFFDVSRTPGVIWRPDEAPLFDVFYWLQEPNEEVAANRPVAMQVDDVIANLVPRMTREGDFVGLVDQNDNTLQFRRHLAQQAFWVEIPAPEQRGSFGSLVASTQLADLLRSLPATIKPTSFPQFRFQAW